MEEHYVTGEVLQAWLDTPADERDLAPAPSNRGDTRRRLLDLDDERSATMDATGVDVQVLSLGPPGLQGLPPAHAAELQQRTNDFLAAAISSRHSRSPGRLRGFAALATNSPRAAAIELARAVQDLGFDGAMIYAAPATPAWTTRTTGRSTAP